MTHIQYKFYEVYELNGLAHSILWYLYNRRKCFKSPSNGKKIGMSKIRKKRELYQKIK